ncbi:3043_t:CDS:2, partial [Dentiscutata erythropus]
QLNEEQVNEKEVQEVKEVTEVKEREIKIQENEIKEVIEVKEKENEVNKVNEVKEKEVNEINEVKENEVNEVKEKEVNEINELANSSVSSLPDLSQFVFTSKDITIAKSSLDLVLKYFKESKLNRDICSKGLEIAQRSKLIFDGIAKEILKRQQSSSLPKIADTEATTTGATATGATTTGTTTTEATTTGTTTTETTTTGTTITETTTTETTTTETKLKLSLSSKFSQSQPPTNLTPSTSGSFESFVEQCDQFYKFGDCLWNISTFFSYSINEDLEMREKILDLIEELDTATIELNEKIEEWKLKNGSRWGSVRNKIKVLAKFSIMRNNSIALLKEKDIKDCKIPVDILKTQRQDIENSSDTITNNSDDNKPILKG